MALTIILLVEISGWIIFLTIAVISVGTILAFFFSTKNDRIDLGLSHDYSPPKDIEQEVHNQLAITPTENIHSPEQSETEELQSTEIQINTTTQSESKEEIVYQKQVVENVTPVLISENIEQKVEPWTKTEEIPSLKLQIEADTHKEPEEETSKIAATKNIEIDSTLQNEAEIIIIETDQNTETDYIQKNEKDQAFDLGMMLDFTPESTPRKGSEEDHQIAQRVARVIVSDIKIYNEQKIIECRNTKNLYDVLKKEFDDSFKIYDERINETIRNESNYLYEAIIKKLCEGNPACLGPNFPTNRINN